MKHARLSVALVLAVCMAHADEPATIDAPAVDVPARQSRIEGLQRQAADMHRRDFSAALLVAEAVALRAASGDCGAIGVRRAERYRDILESARQEGAKAQAIESTNPARAAVRFRTAKRMALGVSAGAGSIGCVP